MNKKEIISITLIITNIFLFQLLRMDTFVFCILIPVYEIFDYSKEYFRTGSAIKTLGNNLIPTEEFNIHDIILKIKKYSTYKNLRENKLVIFKVDLYLQGLVKDGYLTEDKGLFRINI